MLYYSAGIVILQWMSSVPLFAFWCCVFVTNISLWVVDKWVCAQKWDCLEHGTICLYQTSLTLYTCYLLSGMCATCLLIGAVCVKVTCWDWAKKVCVREWDSFVMVEIQWATAVFHSPDCAQLVCHVVMVVVLYVCVHAHTQTNMIIRWWCLLSKRKDYLKFWWLSLSSLFHLFVQNCLYLKLLSCLQLCTEVVQSTVCKFC